MAVGLAGESRQVGLGCCWRASFTVVSRASSGHEARRCRLSHYRVQRYDIFVAVYEYHPISVAVVMIVTIVKIDWVLSYFGTIV